MITNKKRITLRELVPAEGMHLKHRETGAIYEGSIFLGIQDLEDNYEEVSEEEYQQFLDNQNNIDKK